MTDRPTCINHGCNRLVDWSGTRYRPVCGMCSKAGWGSDRGFKYPPGVTPFRTGYCSNHDGHLGFVCPIDYEKAPWAIGLTQIDHIDGNHMNNVIENADELCTICHPQKGKLNGDFKKNNVYDYKAERAKRMALKAALKAVVA